MVLGKELYGIADAYEAPPLAIYFRDSSLPSLLSKEKYKDQTSSDNDTLPIILNDDEMNECKTRVKLSPSFVRLLIERFCISLSIVRQPKISRIDHERTAQQTFVSTSRAVLHYLIIDANDMATFIGDIELLNNQIRELGGTSFEDNMLSSKFLGNLPATYDHLQTMWKSVSKAEQTLQNSQVWSLDEERLICKRCTEFLSSGSRISEPVSMSGRRLHIAVIVDSLVIGILNARSLHKSDVSVVT